MIFGCCSSILAGCVKFMQGMKEQGLDLNMTSGMAEHAKDLLLITAIVELLSIASNFFLLLGLIVPGYGFYLLWVNILGAWFFQEPSPEMDEKAKKKMERKQRHKVSYR